MTINNYNPSKNQEEKIKYKYVNADHDKWHKELRKKSLELKIEISSNQDKQKLPFPEENYFI